MKKIFTLSVICALLLGASVSAQTFPSDPGTLMVDLELVAVDSATGDSISGQAPAGAGSYEAGTTLTITAKDINGYTFLRWDDEVTDKSRQITLTQSVSYTAFYSHDEYTIRFFDAEGTTISETKHYYGDATPQLPAEPQVEATAQYTFVFAGWNPAIESVVVGSQDYHPVYDTIVNIYAITFFDWDGETILYSDSLAYGETPTLPSDLKPTRETAEGIEYEFSAWEPSIQPVTGDQTYIAVYTEKQIEYTATIICGTDTTRQTGHYGDELTIQAKPQEGQHFTAWDNGSTDNPLALTLVGDTTVRAMYADSYIKIAVAANQWTFFCLPQVNEQNGWDPSQLLTDELAGVAYGTYNGELRAAAQSGWENTQTFLPLQGYIIYSTQAGNLKLNAYPENISNEPTSISLQEYESAHEENANWNFVGNPYYAALPSSQINAQGQTDATATVWNGTGYDNELLSSEALIFQPLQAFFIQASGAGSLTFNTPGGAPARRAQAMVEENSRIDIHATSGGYTDKSRIIFRTNSSVKYEAGRDASKFVTATAPIQMYFIDVDNVQCAQMVRPAGEDNIHLGYMLRDAGDIEISMPVYANDYELYDALTDRAYNLDEMVTIYSEAGTFNNRLMLRPIQKVVTSIDTNATESATAKVLVNGQLYLVRDNKLFTVQGQQVK